MTHLPLPWWPKTTTNGGGTTTTTTTTTTTETASTSNCCGGLSKLMRRLKKRSKIMLHPASRQSSFQCRYDPLSYSLNFDKTGSGDFADEDYYKFYAFSSRFVAAPTTTHCPRVLVAASHWSPNCNFFFFLIFFSSCIRCKLIYLDGSVVIVVVRIYYMAAVQIIN